MVCAGSRARWSRGAHEGPGTCGAPPCEGARLIGRAAMIIARRGQRRRRRRCRAFPPFQSARRGRSRRRGGAFRIVEARAGYAHGRCAPRRSRSSNVLDLVEQRPVADLEQLRGPHTIHCAAPTWRMNPLGTWRTGARCPSETCRLRGRLRRAIRGSGRGLRRAAIPSTIIRLICSELATLPGSDEQSRGMVSTAARRSHGGRVGVPLMSPAKAGISSDDREAAAT